MIASDNLDTIDRCRNLALRTPITILITAVPVVLLFAKAFNLGGMKMDRGISSLFLVMIAVMVVVNSYGVRWMANRKRFFEHISMVATNGTTQSFRSFDQVGRWSRIADAANQVIRERSQADEATVTLA